MLSLVELRFAVKDIEPDVGFEGLELQPSSCRLSDGSGKRK